MNEGSCDSIDLRLTPYFICIITQNFICIKIFLARSHKMSQRDRFLDS